MKSMIKRIIVGVCIGMILFFIKSCNVHAYETIYTNGGNCTPGDTPGIVDPNGNGWGNNHCFMPNQNTWVLSGDHSWYGENMNGNIYTVIADYYIGIETRSGVTMPAIYYNTARMSMTSNNLRCGVGSYRTGYDSTYSPTISNFKVEYLSGINPGNLSTRDTYHITFKYSQRLGTNRTGNGNMSCWFDIPGNSLLTQLNGNTVDNLLFTYVKDFRYSISDSADTGLLQTITSQNQTIINQNQQQITNQNTMIQQNQDIYNNITNQTQVITDTTVPSNNQIANAVDTLKVDVPSNITDVITIIPQTLQVIVNGFNNKCAGGYYLGDLFGHSLTIPCINPEQYLGSFIWGTIDAILCLCFIIPFSKHLVNTYNSFTTLEGRKIH